MRDQYLILVVFILIISCEAGDIQAPNEKTFSTDGPDKSFFIEANKRFYKAPFLFNGGEVFATGVAGFSLEGVNTALTFDNVYCSRSTITFEFDNGSQSSDATIMGGQNLNGDYLYLVILDSQIAGYSNLTYYEVPRYRASIYDFRNHEVSSCDLIDFSFDESSINTIGKRIKIQIPSTEAYCGINKEINIYGHVSCL